MNLEISMIVTALLATSAGVAVSDPGEPRRYGLSDESSFQVGCLEPCQCPVLLQSTAGTFVLVPAEDNPLFREFEVIGIDWKIPGGHEGVRVTGSGKYRVGGEVAQQHRLTLDLRVGDGPPQRFDSGMVIGGHEFPVIDIAIAVNQFHCFDSVFVLRAGPLVSAVAGDRGVSLHSPAPNPFRDRTEVSFSLRRAGPVEIVVHDLQGRTVETLARATWLEPGRHSRVWDGRSHDGRDLGPGLYFVRLEADGRRETRMVVKLR